MADELLAGITMGAQVVGVPTAPSLSPAFPPPVLFVSDNTGMGHHYTVPHAGDYLIELWGGGGSGGGGPNSTATTGGGAGGGGAGAYAAGLFTYAGGEVIPYQVGRGGNAKIHDQNGQDGLNSTWNTSDVVAAAGKGGLSAGGGGAAGLAADSTGDLTRDGGAGADSDTATINGGGGGGSGSSLGAGIDAPADGTGGPATQRGGGAGGAGGTATDSAGAGGAPGAGSGGGKRDVVGGTSLAGSAGRIRIWNPPPPWWEV
jgi:hypothetical protein